MSTLLDVIQRFRRCEVDRSDWLYIAGDADDLMLSTEADLGRPAFDEERDLEIAPPGFAEQGLRSTIDADAVASSIEWADRLSGSADDAAAAEIIRYYIRFDAWPEMLNAPDPPSPEESMHRNDCDFVDRLGPEDATRKCQRNGCDHGAVKLSLYCRRHHFENFRKRSYPYSE